MCEYCKKAFQKGIKYGMQIDLETAKGIYDNHRSPRYVICNAKNKPLWLCKTIEEARKQLLNDWIYGNPDEHIVDLEKY